MKDECEKILRQFIAFMQDKNYEFRIEEESWEFDGQYEYRVMRYNPILSYQLDECILEFKRKMI